MPAEGAPLQGKWIQTFAAVVRSLFQGSWWHAPKPIHLRSMSRAKRAKPSRCLHFDIRSIGLHGALRSLFLLLIKDQGRRAPLLRPFVSQAECATVIGKASMYRGLATADTDPLLIEGIQTAYVLLVQRSKLYGRDETCVRSLPPLSKGS